MEYYILGVLAVFGLLIGSFLNVVILRFDTGASIGKGRSKCFSCEKTLSWYELFPLFSFLIQKGRCRGCATKISWQYPLVELLGALAFPIAYLVNRDVLITPVGFISWVLTATLLCLYIVITVYDLRHKIIPDVFSYSAAGIALCALGLDWYVTGSFDLTRFGAGLILAFFFFFFWIVSRGTWMGLGDAKLALSVGWFLGLWQGIAAILLSFWIGAAISIVVMATQKIVSRKKGLGMKSEIPFGPYILLGFMISLLWHVDFQTILLYLPV